ncbi:putative oxidoreductase [Pseudovirgaria hyperparasitica]|uniref:Putative oxidoreductase n=1 Tax=Pseudovirgaria hyperparasitica TaxID=470096 RepID=A0A6A6WCF7_9PEZI|nr:putative oxidoreductase [Pseudovirgaria hyperparasitica]KAF2760255.1 putative oxidoreductase [Pseudovirgaria hyperparasitica]
MAFSMALPWSEGEEEMHRLLHVPNRDNPTSSMLTPQAAFSLRRFPLLAVGVIDAEGRPWVTVWGGESGFSRPLSNTIVGTKTYVDRVNDPVVQCLVGGRADGEVVKEEGTGRMVSALTIDLMTRKRVKLYGRMVAGALANADEGENEEPNAVKPVNQGLIQLVVNVEQSLGNCPKYLNKKEVTPAPIQSKLVSDSPKLSTKALELLGDADLFFVSSYYLDTDMDTNHRGGPPGFVRVLSNDSDGTEIVWPEYSGNRLYQTLGNLCRTPKAGLAFPNFVTGDILYVTGDTEILIGEDAAKLLPHTNLLVKLKIRSAKLVESGLPFRGVPGELSPYNPHLRLLVKEGRDVLDTSRNPPNNAMLEAKTELTPTISRYRFSTSAPISYDAGQWVALDFSEELDIGYSHMRDDDPASLNDDFIRTFTISSPPSGPHTNIFEITARKNGPVTSFLERQRPNVGLTVPIRGIGGDFKITIPQGTDDQVISFIAGGVGITPLLSQLQSIPIPQLRLLWAVRKQDLGIVADTLSTYNDLGPQTTLFVTETGASEQTFEGRRPFNLLQEQGTTVIWRRIQKEDLEIEGVHSFYICAGVALQNTLLKWLDGRNAISESFNY